MHIKIASRSSDLARWQAIEVAREIKKKHPQVEIEHIFRSSFGDQNLDISLTEMESRGVFTQDFYEGLVDGTFDVVVHSWKDLPVEDREETEVVATIDRADVRDVFLVPKEVFERAKKNGKLQVLTSSPRRIYNLTPWLLKLLPNFKGEIEYVPVRGNIPSRLDKMFSQDSALILAKAALDRMLSGSEGFEEVKKKTFTKFSQCHFMVLPLEINPCAPAQGALAIEISSKREDLKGLLRSINNDEVFHNVEMERQILKSYGGGCHQKIGVARLIKNFGVYHIEKGESDWGTKLDRCELLQNRKSYDFKGMENSQAFPLKASENSWFERKIIPISDEQLKNRVAFVARHAQELTALKSAAQIWTAGVKTWEKLAQEGYWVNGCFESLGEDEKHWVGPISEGLEWVKLTHADTNMNTKLQVLPYYKIESKSFEESPNLNGKKAFYWMSPSSFERALELYPDEVRAGFHSCGPGLTYEALKDHPEVKNGLEVFLNLEEFHDFLKRNGMKF